MNVRPPDLETSWDGCDLVDRANMIAYSQLRNYEEEKFQIDFLNNLVKIMSAR